MTPALLLLFLALTSSLTERVQCQDAADEDGEDGEDPNSDPPVLDPELTTETTLQSSTASDAVDDPVGEQSGDGIAADSETDATTTPPNDLNPSIIIIPLVLVLVIICLVVAGVMISRWCRSKAADPVQQDAYLDACEGEKVPMPMFEDDVPSVLELEMEDLEKWMVKDGGGSNLNSGPV